MYLIIISLYAEISKSLKERNICIAVSQPLSSYADDADTQKILDVLLEHENAKGRLYAYMIMLSYFP